MEAPYRRFGKELRILRPRKFRKSGEFALHIRESLT